MFYLFLVVTIIFSVMISDKNNEIKFYKNKISQLEARLKKYEINQEPSNTNQATNAIKEVPKTVSPPPVAQNNSNNLASKTATQVSGVANTATQKVVTNTVPKIDEAERLRKIEKKKSIVRNNAILALGATFIVIAALSFLYSTWYTVPNIVKSAVVLILAGVFMGLSKVSAKVFKLTKTARAFFYIAMAYIPLCLFSISFLGLAGEYFSISGDGRYLYLTFVCLLVMGMYLFFANKNKDKKLYISGLVMQLFFVICFGLIFTTKFDAILTLILAYTALFTLITQKREMLFSKLNKVYADVLIGVFLYFAAGILIFTMNKTLIDVLLALMVLINFVILYKLNNKNSALYCFGYVSSLILLVKLINLEIFNFSFIVKQILVISYIICSSVYYNFKCENDLISKFINVINLLTIFLLSFITKFFVCEGIEAFIIATISMFLSTVEYIKNKRADVGIYTTSLILNSLLFLIPNSIFNSSISIIEYIVCTLVALCMIIVLHKDKNVSLKLIPLILLFINLYRYDIILFKTFDFTYVLNVLAILSFLVLSIRDKKDFAYRITSLLFLIGFVIDIESYINIYVASLIISSWIWIQYYFSTDGIKNVLKGCMFIPLVITYFSILGNDITLITYFISILQSLVCLYVYRNSDAKIVPLLGLMLPLYTYKIIIFDKIDITFLINILIVITTGALSIKDKKDIVYKITSLFYLIGMCIYAEMSVYVSLLLITIWAVIQMLFAEGEIKKGMKAIIIASLVLMYMVMLEDGPSDITVKAYTITILESLFCWFIFSRSKCLKALPIIGLMIPLYSYDLMAIGKYDITFLVNIALITILSYFFINSKQDKVYLVTSFIYLVGLVLKYIEINVYIKLAMFIVWGFVNYLYTDKGLKDLMKALISTCVLGVYINVLEDLELVEVTALIMIGFLVYAHFLTRGIFKNHMKEYKVLEYLACVYIYIIAFNMYNDAVDLAIFIVMQAIVLMFAYSKKIGPAFVITVPAILINMFYLTQNFWLSIPWWAYLVCVGGVLIVFAARNELSEKKDIKTVKEKLEKVKNYLDM